MKRLSDIPRTVPKPTVIERARGSFGMRSRVAVGILLSAGGLPACGDHTSPADVELTAQASSERALTFEEFNGNGTTWNFLSGAGAVQQIFGCLGPRRRGFVGEAR